MSTKHTPGPWENREGEIIADTRTQSRCGQPCVGGEYMGQQEMVCCGNFEVDGGGEDVIARVTYECDIPLIVAAPDMRHTLDVIATALETLGDYANLAKLARDAIAKADGAKA